jgi:hypothetical protein
MVVLLADFWFPALLRGQAVPLGGQFRVNTYTAGGMFQPAVASDADGDFVVVWVRADGDRSFGVFGQRYRSNGAPRGDEFRVNTYTTGGQSSPSVASDADGDFIVIWHSGNDQDGDGFGGFGQRYQSSGARLGREFRINTYTSSGQGEPNVASDADGDFVVVWQSGSFADNSPFSGLFGRRYRSTGSPLGGQFRVSSYNTSVQFVPKVATDADGDFAVVWWGVGMADNAAVFGRRFRSNGTALGEDFLVNSDITLGGAYPEVAIDTDGDFVVVWEKGYKIFGRRFQRNGAPLGAQFRVTSDLPAFNMNPALAMDAEGDFVVTWSKYSLAFRAYDVFAKSYRRSGAPLGEEFLVNRYSTDDQGYAAVASESDGSFVVVWRDRLRGSSYFSISGQRYAPPGQPPEVADSGPGSVWPLARDGSARGPRPGLAESRSALPAGQG